MTSAAALRLAWLSIAVIVTFVPLAVAVEVPEIAPDALSTTSPVGSTPAVTAKLSTCVPAGSTFGAPVAMGEPMSALIEDCG